MNFSHRSVLLDECIESLNIKPDGIYVDGTAGGGGHSLEIVKRLTDGGRLVAIDRDDAAIAAATERLSDYLDRVTFVRNNFSSAADVCRELGIERIDGILLDLGVSSYQLDTAERGFSHNNDAPLDMRMDRRGELDAYTVVNTYTFEELKRVIWEYGEERFAPKIASAIVKRRETKPIESTGELVDVIKSAIPAAAREGGHHPAKRTFQAIRIEVNGELDAIAPAIRNAKDIMAEGGRIVIITFHSLEDRIVKQTYADMASGCTCPKNLPICVCGKRPEVKVLTKKPILPSERELEGNPRSRSAKLRVCEKL
ncbi:MAG: 16S rRNA (cytosine(1402)-N(4))-methyltransferase RsmH [Ruminococcaceae bacterium]|nr:16S rRNA (cytosine(1402)-N(4))-methyltransferase RsmH [Oscillospiraceae bacterium]